MSLDVDGRPDDLTEHLRYKVLEAGWYSAAAAALLHFTLRRSVTFFPACWHLPQNGGTIFCPLHISFCGWFIMALNKLHHQGRLRDDYLPVFLARRLFSVGARGALFVIHLSKEKRQYPGTDTRQHSRADDREQSPVGRSFSCTPICA